MIPCMFVIGYCSMMRGYLLIQLNNSFSSKFILNLLPEMKFMLLYFFLKLSKLPSMLELSEVINTYFFYFLKNGEYISFYSNILWNKKRTE